MTMKHLPAAISAAVIAVCILVLVMRQWEGASSSMISTSVQRAAELADGAHAEDPGPPPASVAAVAMCTADEPGERLEFYGRVLDENGRPLRAASVIAYGTDATGLYVPRDAERTMGRNPRLRGVAVTDAEGWYRFTTIKPAPYPDISEPSHVHMHVDAAVHRHMYRTVWFEGDALITDAKRASLDAETVIIPLTRREDGVLVFRHDIRLGGS
jgi:protocatechuate 3,4-dioxygenase beta subunit